jgi:hypothetical protein
MLLVRTPVRSWLLGVGAVVALSCATFVSEAVATTPDDPFRFFGTVIIGWYATLGWCIVGLVVLLTTPPRRRWPVAENVVHAAVLAVLFLGAAVWIWFLVFAGWSA